MSVQFGRYNFDGHAENPDFASRVCKILEPYGPDGQDVRSVDGLLTLYLPFFTNSGPHREPNPFSSASGTVISWDGRLDNRAELIRDLDESVSAHKSDVQVVAAAFEKWDVQSFARLLGDWALAIWDPRKRTIILAKDLLGSRPLYYFRETNRITWCTILNPLVLLASKRFTLCEEYMAGALSQFPAEHLTPYAGIHSVPACSFVALTTENTTTRKYWDFDPTLRVRYPSDADYEEHYRRVFAQSIRRRIRSNGPVLAELSGGMDSSSIVCMADVVLAEGKGETSRLDTVSYYDDSEPNWDERPYFTSVEKWRGRPGCHIWVGGQHKLRLQTDSEYFAPTPACENFCSQSLAQFASCISSQGNRVLLSGFGGDEVTGGVTTPLPELTDLLARFDVRRLAHQLKLWALKRRQPWFRLLAEAIGLFLSSGSLKTDKRLSSLFYPAFAHRNCEMLMGFRSRMSFVGPLPSFQENLSTLDALRRQVAYFGLSPFVQIEKRYPYLDRDFLQFLYAIPREQIVRPGQRRSLMRRALSGIVPDEVLHRKRKAFVVRNPTVAMPARWDHLRQQDPQMLTDRLGFVDFGGVERILETAKNGKEIPVTALMRILLVETWLRHADAWCVVDLQVGANPSANTHYRAPHIPLSAEEKI